MPYLICRVSVSYTHLQKVTIKYGGVTIQPDNSRLPDMLRKKSEIGKVSISKRQIVSVSNMKAVKSILREYFDVMDVPDDEDGLVAFIVKKFTEPVSYTHLDVYKRTVLVQLLLRNSVRVRISQQMYC